MSSDGARLNGGLRVHLRGFANEVLRQMGWLPAAARVADKRAAFSGWVKRSDAVVAALLHGLVVHDVEDLIWAWLTMAACQATAVITRKGACQMAGLPRVCATLGAPDSLVYKGASVFCKQEGLPGAEGFLDPRARGFQ